MPHLPERRRSAVLGELRVFALHVRVVLCCRVPILFCFCLAVPVTFSRQSGQACVHLVTVEAFLPPERLHVQCARQEPFRSVDVDLTLDLSGLPA